MKKVYKCIDKLTSILVGLSSIVFAAIVIIVLSSVIKRAIFGSPIRGTVEIVQFGVMFCIAIALAKTTLQNRHTQVTMLTDALPVTIQKILDIFMKVISVGVFGLLLYMLVQEFQKVTLSSRVSEALLIPYSLIYGALIVGAAVTLLVLIYQFILSVTLLFKSNEPIVSENGINTDDQPM